MQAASRIPLTGLANTLPGSFETARIVVPDEAARDDIGAASAVSARLGYNMVGMTLPPVAKSSQVDLAPDKRPLILVGLNQPRIPAAIEKRVSSLKETQGLVAWASGVIVIAGPLPVGTRIAAEAFAGRTPYVWDAPGKDANTTFSRVAEDLAGVLKAAGVDLRSLSFDEIVFEKGRDEAVSATMTATVTRGSIQKARVAVHAGRAKLSYSGVAALTVKVTDGQASDVITVDRS